MTRKPQRIQLRRTKGWRLPQGAVSVARPTKWGNPYRVADYEEFYPGSTELDRRKMAVGDFRGMLNGDWVGEEHDYPLIHELRGKDLACWCPLPEPGQPDVCHAAVLIELSNRSDGDRA